MILEIATVDRTTDIKQDSLRYVKTLSKAPSRLTFSMVAGGKTIPAIGDSVVFKLDDVNTYFSGTITSRKARTIGNSVVVYSFICQDHYYDMDRKLVIKAYKNTDAGTVINDIVTNFMDGFTFTPPASTPTVKTARFNYVEPSRCIKKIAEDTGYDWYVDEAKEVHLVAAGDLAAPLEVNDTNGSYISNSLTVEGDLSELKNAVYVRGGEYENTIAESAAVDKYKANGTDNTFPLVYRYANVQVTVDGTAQNVGVDYLDDPASFDCLYNFNEKLVRFPDGTLTSGQVVKVFGDAKIPLIVQLTDDTSIAAYGRREHIEINKAINSVEEAEQLASALIDKWRGGSKDVTFKTYNTGFKVGQTVTVNSAKFGLNETYTVTRVAGSMHGYNDFVFTIELLKAGQTTFDDIMVNLIGRDRDNVTIAENEVIQRLLSIEDTFSMSDEIVSVTTNTGPYEWSPVGSGTVGEWDFFTWA